MEKDHTINTQVLREIALRELNDRLEQAIKRILLPTDWDSFPIDYYCECSNEDCRSRVALTFAERALTNSNPANFIIKTKHETIGIDIVTDKGNGYQIVQKNLTSLDSTNHR